jgi:hypothetical protein
VGFLCGLDRAGNGFCWVVAGADLAFEGDSKPIEASWGGFWGELGGRDRRSLRGKSDLVIMIIEDAGKPWAPPEP